MEALRAAGALVEVLSLDGNPIQGMVHDQKGRMVDVGKVFSAVDAADYDALVLPGGVANPDTLRIEDEAVALVRAISQARKPIAAICHGPWTLINAEAIDGRWMTS